MDDHRGQGINWWQLLGWVLSLAALGFLVNWILKVDHRVWASFFKVKPWRLLASLAVFQLWFLTRYLGWEWISRQFGSQANRQGNIRMWTTSELMRYIPGNIWSFAARYRGSRTAGSSRHQAAAALVVEALSLIGGAVLVVMAFSAALWGSTLWWAIGLLILSIPLLSVLLPSVAKRWPALASLGQLRWTHLTILLFWYALVWVTFGIANAILIASFPSLVFQATALFYGVASVLAWMVGYVSIITPMGLGVREVTLAKLLESPIGGAGAGAASLVALATRVWLVVSEIIFLALVFLFSSTSKRT